VLIKKIILVLLLKTQYEAKIIVLAKFFKSPNSHKILENIRLYVSILSLAFRLETREDGSRVINERP
jgi:hypothetical protein